MRASETGLSYLLSLYFLERTVFYCGRVAIGCLARPLDGLSSLRVRELLATAFYVRPGPGLAAALD